MTDTPSEPAPHGEPGATTTRRFHVKRVIGWAVLAFVVSLLIAGGVAAYGGWKAYSAAKEAKSLASSGDLVAAATYAAPIADGLSLASTAVNSPPVDVLTWIPWVGDAVENAQNLASAAAHGSAASATVAAGLTSKPVAGGAVDTGIVTGLVKRWEGAASQEAGDALAHADAVVASGPYGPKLRAYADTAVELGTRAKDALDALASSPAAVDAALGVKKPATYLITIGNPAELRASGGAPLNVALLKVDDGRVSLPYTETTGVVFQGHRKVAYNSVTPRPWGVAGPTEQRFVNANFHPDFRFSGRDLLSCWNADQPDAQGVIAIDTEVLEAILRATGPITIGAYGTITADNASAKLLEDAYRDFADDSASRHGLNSQLAEALAAKVLKGDGLSASIGEVLAIAPGRHLQILMADTGLQKAVAQMRLDGSIPAAEESVDRLGVYSQNVNQSKVDVYSKRSLHHDVTLAEDGSATVTSTLTVTNDSPAALNRKVRIGYLTAWSQNLWNLYVPNGAENLQFALPKGYSKPTSVADDGFGRRVEQFIGWIDPGASVTFVATYTLPAGTFTRNGQLAYTLMASPQPISNPLDLNLTVRGPRDVEPSDGIVSAGSEASWTGPLDQALRVTIPFRGAA